MAPLRELLARSSSAVTRVHALWTLDGLGALQDADLMRALGDPVAGVREHAVRLAAARRAHAPELWARVLALGRDAAVRVRYQVAFAAATGSDDAAAETTLARMKELQAAL